MSSFVVADPCHAPLVAARQQRLFNALETDQISLNADQRAAIAKAARLDIEPTIADLHDASHCVRALLALWVETTPKHMRMLDMLSVAFGLRSLHAAQAQLPPARPTPVLPWSYTAVPVVCHHDTTFDLVCEMFPALGTLVGSALSVVFVESLPDQPLAWTDGHTLYLPAPHEKDTRNTHSDTYKEYVPMIMHALLGHAQSLAQAVLNPDIDARLYALALDIHVVHTLLTRKNFLLKIETKNFSLAFQHVFSCAFSYRLFLKGTTLFWHSYPTPMSIYAVLCDLRDRNALHLLAEPVDQKDMPFKDKEILGMFDRLTEFVDSICAGHTIGSWAPSVVLPVHSPQVFAKQAATVLDLTSACQGMYAQNHLDGTSKHVDVLHAFVSPAIADAGVCSGKSWTRAHGVLATLHFVEQSHQGFLDNDTYYQALAQVLRTIGREDIGRVVALLSSYHVNLDNMDFLISVGWALYISGHTWAASAAIEIFLNPLLQDKACMAKLFHMRAYLLFGHSRGTF